ncbi:hypothetical protein B0H17DRAFT_1217781 [Mycena rosella]|uniref:Uncharacterized protein n=1 Tax=Mycena rosella TaxID=1033263 RepID=A0AAD7BV90_MYCRO|nr:hypothetical protein B0H17DRAFT_1217781 [Mycena rosella]
MGLPVRRQAFIALWSLSQCSIVFRVSPGLQSAGRLFHRARRIPPDADSTRRASGSWACRLNAPHEHPRRGKVDRRRTSVSISSSGTLRTRPPPTPSFALHTATPAPPHALLSRFPALIAPSSVRQRSGTRRPALPTLEQHHLVVQYLHDTGVPVPPYALRCRLRGAPLRYLREGACCLYPTRSISGAPALPSIRAPHAAEMELDRLRAFTFCVVVGVRAFPHVHRRPEPIAQGRAAYGLVKIRGVIFFVRGRAAASVLARVHISDTRRAPAAVDKRVARTARGGGRSGQRKAYLACENGYAQSAYAGPAGTRKAAARARGC